VLGLVLYSSKIKTVIIYKKCPICQGNGITKCSSCSGAGKIKVYIPYCSSKKNYRIEKCPRCGGSGFAYKCYYCGGLGKVKKDSVILGEVE
jgi:DnaJ-class molecular chaperone